MDSIVAHVLVLVCCIHTSREREASCGGETVCVCVQVAAAMEEFDTDSSGDLDFHEFVCMVCKSEAFKFKWAWEEKETLMNMAELRSPAASPIAAAGPLPLDANIDVRMEAPPFNAHAVQVEAPGGVLGFIRKRVFKLDLSEVEKRNLYSATEEIQASATAQGLSPQNM